MALVRRFTLLNRTLRRTVPRTESRHYFFLPSSYHLDETWQKRLESPLVKQIRLEQFFVELRKRFEQEKTGSPLDVDIFASAVQNPEDLRFLEDLLFYLRSTKNTVQTRKSTCNSVVRSFLEGEKYEDLMKILAEKTKFGMFFDAYTAALLMDKMISLNRHSDAARVAIDLMLQEDFLSFLGRDLSLYSCLSFLKTGEWDSLMPLNLPPPPPPDNGEEVVVYVPFLKNEFFDDHFDLIEPKHRLGKTLLKAGGVKNDLLGRSAQILGLSLYEKWTEGVALLNTFALSPLDTPLLTEAVQAFVEALQKQTELPGDEGKSAELKAFLGNAERAKKKLQDAGRLKEGSLLELSEQQVKETVKETAEEEAMLQKTAYENATKNREKEIGKQIRRFELNERLRTLNMKRKKLADEEDVLFFFERKNEWEKSLTEEARDKMKEEERLQGSWFDFRVEDPSYQIEQIETPKTYKPFTRWRRPQEQYDAKLKELAK